MVTPRIVKCHLKALAQVRQRKSLSTWRCWRWRSSSSASTSCCTSLYHQVHQNCLVTNTFGNTAGETRQSRLSDSRAHNQILFLWKSFRFEWVSLKMKPDWSLLLLFSTGTCLKSAPSQPRRSLLRTARKPNALLLRFTDDTNCK